ncbi:MAG: hypothetical protein F4Z17_11340 [Acidimicrobiia bacterium]|nr:hypothetical protein [Acidimicrobiia bacterium]
MPGVDRAPVLLHISDLHRSIGEPVSNAELVAALERDLSRQAGEDPPIPPPDALVVSGDLVMGARLDDPDPGATIRAQYRQAEELLGEITELLFGGDRSQVVICPGNHDVDWCQARASMEIVPEADIPADVYAALAEPGSLLRWDWSDCALYRIVDPIAYGGRMDKYRNFLNQFYGDTGVLKLPASGDDPLLVELFDRRVLIAAFNSCWENDCYRRRGGIKPEAIARMHLDLLDQAWEYDLRIAVWHHSTVGPPSADDYLNVEQVYALIDNGFRLGLHGHQHRSELSLHELRRPEYGSLAVVSAGSLAAGHAELPRGANRQYNIVELHQDLTGARVHFREIETGGFGPRRLNSFGGRSYSDVFWNVAPSIVGTSIDSHGLNQSTMVNSAETAFQAGDDEKVLALLCPIASELDAYGRRLLADAATRAENWLIVIDHYYPPSSIAEVALVVKAAVRLDDFELARSTVRYGGENLGLPSPQQVELRDWISAEELIR